MVTHTKQKSPRGPSSHVLRVVDVNTTEELYIDSKIMPAIFQLQDNFFLSVAKWTIPYFYIY